VASIHPTAIISPAVRLGEGVSIGPYSIIEEDVVIGDRCTLAAHVHVRRDTHLAEDNQVFEGTVLGGW
jgi:UDP-N-acetylglucosamine acyltransferase